VAEGGGRPKRRRARGAGEHSPAEDSMLRAGLRGIAIVTLATVGLGLVALVIALLVSALV
jgi:hypothetical protein